MAACENDSTGLDEGPARGTFTATVSGDLSASIDGEAFFGEGTDPDTGETGWVLWLTTSESETAGQAIYFVRFGSRPGPGTHALADLRSDDDLLPGETAALFFDYASGSFAGLFGSTAGSLVVGDFDSDHAEGPFTINAIGTTFQDGEATESNVTVTGDFNAVGGDVFFPSM